jgi:cell division transport system permease protein
LQGLISSVISLFMLVTLLLIIDQKLPDLDIFKNWLIIVLVGLLIVAFGILITWLSNFIAIKKYLKLSSEDLY